MADNSTECKLYPGENSKCLALKYTKLVACTLSIIGALFALIVILYFRLFRDFKQRMVINLCVASLLMGISYMMTQFEDDVTPLCKAQAFGITFSIWACLLWVMCIAANIYTRVIFNYIWKQKEVLASLTCWAVSFVMALLPLLCNVYAPTEVWCWIKNDTGWRFGIWYTWHILSIFVFIAAMVHIICVLNKNQSRHSVQDLQLQEVLREDIRTLRRYPIVYTAFSIVAIVCRIINISQGSSFVMLLLFGLTLPLFGTAVTCVFVIDKTTLRLFNRKEIRKAYLKWTGKDTQVRSYSKRNNRSGKDNKAADAN